MFQRSDGDTQVRPDSRPSSPYEISPPRYLRPAQTAMPGLYLSDTIDPSQGQRTKTSHACSWTEKTRRGECYRTYSSRYVADLTSLNSGGFCSTSVSMCLLEQQTSLFRREVAQHQWKSDGLLRLFLLRAQPSIFYVEWFGLADVSSHSSLQPDITAKFRQKIQRTILFRGYAVNDPVWSLPHENVPDASTLVLRESVWRRRTPPKLH
jgi:hypothetical protein